MPEPNMPPTSDWLASSSRALRLLWMAAVLVALVNLAANLRRIPIQHREAQNPDEWAAQAAASWLRAQPAPVRALLLLHRQDIGPVWFSYRLNYFIYPRRFEIAWNALPPDAARNFDFVLAYHSAQSAVPSDWKPLSRVERATLYESPAASNLDIIATLRESSEVARLPLLLRLGLVLFGAAAIIALGALLLGSAVPAPIFRWPLANLALAHLAGAAALAGLLTLTAQITGKLQVWPVYLLLALLLRRARRAWQWLFPARPPVGEIVAITIPKNRAYTFWFLLLAGLTLLGILTAIWRGGLLGLDWDGYAIWQLKAKAFFLDGDLTMLRDGAHYEYAHRDYPLLVPLQSWWLYAHWGSVSDRLAQCANFLFYLDLLILFAACAARHVSRGTVLLGAALLAAHPILAHHAASGFADVPLATYLLAMGACLSARLVEQDRRQTPLLAWLFAGAILVKNEGALLCLSGLMVPALYALWSRKSALWRAWLLWAGASLASYLPWLLQKRAWDLRNDVIQPGTSVAFTPGLLFWRLGVALQGFVESAARIGPRYPCWGLLLPLVLIGPVVTVKRRVAVAGPLWLLAGCQLVGYTVIYLITPHPLKAHLSTSVNRLWLHLLPTIALAALLGSFAPARMEESPEPNA